MKGPRFNAALTLANQNTDIRLARSIAPLRGHIDETKWRMLNNVLRPFLHEMNFARSENAEPLQVNEAVTAVIVSQLLEFMMATLPKGTSDTILQNVASDFITDITESLVHAINTNYGTALATGGAATPPPASLN